ncbi:MAG TPA: hypothetical protein VD863_02765 [Bradyrhizobium sp.]|nr:hypothetical protein [Bradyrhizobium sp.]
MPLIEAALAFAITMLALSLVVSSFVEIIHRIFSMREAGLKYMLGQMFDQVLGKYLQPEQLLKLVDTSKLPDAAKANAGELLKIVRTGFVERMSANRAPMGVAPKATPTDPAEQVARNPKTFLGLWNGRDLASMTPTEFMERLGSIDVGAEIKNAASDGGKAAADVLDTALKDIAQKFEAFGKEAGTYFEGRARLLSVIVAIVLAFAAHVDAIDLFKTYLRDPNARAKVIEQSTAVTAQYKAAKDAADAISKLAPAGSPVPADVKPQVEQIQKDLKAAIGNVDATIQQYADLGTPIGWNDNRFKAAHIGNLAWLCPAAVPAADPQRPWLGQCKLGTTFALFTDPTAIAVWFYLLLGGLLIGLGAPFWYNAVTGLTNIRNTVRGATGADVQSHAAVAAVEAGKAQPVTPVGSFEVASAAAARMKNGNKPAAETNG